MIDKRFWSGAIVVATVVIAGASALPALLLAPSAPEPMIPVTAAPAEWKAHPVVTRIEPRPVARAEAPVPAQPAPAAPEPQVAAAPPPVVPQPPVAPPATPVREAASPVAFPPVQPVGVVASKMETSSPIAAPPLAAPRAADATSSRPAIEKPARAQRTAAQRVTKRKRHAVRPALFPLREFLAWRR